MSELHLLSPFGFRAAGVYAGLKTKQKADVGLLLGETPCDAAALFTSNTVFAAPVKIGREHVRGGALRGIVVNSGNANACTGRQGEKDARRMCELAAKVAECAPEEILPSSTGIIGHQLPMAKVERGIVEAGAFLGNSLEHAHLFADAIMTTDTKRKVAGVEFKIGRRKVVLAGIAKGAGMIGPRLGPPQATMLSYLTTDAQVPAALLRKLLFHAADASFNCVTIDDHASTNDTVCILASGASGARVGRGREAQTFGAALDDVCQALAFQIAADGEGATKVIHVVVDKAKTEAAARAIARAIANSPLVKCAMHGNDPNWGRIVSAAGYAGVDFNPDKCTLIVEGTPLFAKGQPLHFDAHLVSQSLKSVEVRVHLTCNTGKAQAAIWTCDLSKDYVTINADYHT